MTLGDKQRLFVKLVGRLIEWAYKNGYELSIGDAYRDPRSHGAEGEKKTCEGKTVYGRSRSNHKRRLAIDLNLFKKDATGQLQYLTANEDYVEIGQYWESLHPLASSGINFSDGNHFSLEDKGMR